MARFTPAGWSPEVRVLPGGSGGRRPGQRMPIESLDDAVFGQPRSAVSNCPCERSGLGYAALRRGVRVAEGARLESVCTLIAYRGFESLPLRQARLARSGTVPCAARIRTASGQSRLSMAARTGPLATIAICEPRQARKGAAVATDASAGVWLVRAASIPVPARGLLRRVVHRPLRQHATHEPGTPHPPRRPHSLAGWRKWRRLPADA